MELRSAILKEHSKQNCDRIVNWIGHSQERYDQLVDLFLHDEYRVVQRAAWPLSEIALKYPDLVKKHLDKIIDNLKKPGLHEAVKRNTVRLLQVVELPKKYHGIIMSNCFDYLQSPAEKPAVKANAITVLQRLSEQYPEIKSELRTIVETQWDHESAAFKSRARKITGG